MNTSPTIIIHRSLRKIKNGSGRSPLLTVVPERLKQLCRSSIMADLSPTEPLWGLDPWVVSLSPYMRCTTGCSSPVEIPRGSIVIPVRSSAGRIWALHDDHLRWFTLPKPHVVNFSRSLWTNCLEVFDWTIEADAAANSRNVAAIALNGFEFQQLSANLVGHSPHIITKQEEVAA